MEQFYYEPEWSTPGLSDFYRYYDEEEYTESLEIYCCVDTEKAFDDIHYLAEARFIIDNNDVRFYLSPHEHVLERLPCMYEAACETISDIYEVAPRVYGRVVKLSMADAVSGQGTKEIKRIRLFG